VFIVKEFERNSVKPNSKPRPERVFLRGQENKNKNTVG
jgi:hypothetical protein